MVKPLVLKYRTDALHIVKEFVNASRDGNGSFPCSTVKTAGGTRNIRQSSSRPSSLYAFKIDMAPTGCAKPRKPHI
jgi:hypothetical protein